MLFAVTLKEKKMKRFDNYSKSKSLVWLMASLLAALVTGCGSGGGAAPGTLGVSLTDAPACGFDAVNVTVVKVRVHQSSSATDTDAGWTDITLNHARKINLLDWNNGGLTTLGVTPLAAGRYTQLRLVLDPNTAEGLANSVVPTGGAETPLVTPSAVQSGIKLINEFDVASGQRVDLVLDFNACKSIVLRGNGTYALKPVIKVTPFVLNGIDGFVDTALLGSSVMVTAQQNGVVVQSTAPNATTGEFFLARLAPGNYDVVLSADGHAAAVITTVPVAGTTSIVAVSTIAQPITLPTSATHIISGTVTLNPPSLTEVAYVTVRQWEIVKSVAVDGSAPSAYTLTFPISALLGQYSAVLPIAFATLSAGAGGYPVDVTVTATGYMTVATMMHVISAGDLTGLNFTLTP